MGRHTGSATAAPSASGAPTYVRMLRLRHIHLGGLACFLLFEVSVGASVLAALAGVLSWWAVGVVPVCVAAMVKLNDMVAGHLEALAPPPIRRRPAPRPPTVTGRAAVVPVPPEPPVAADAEPDRRSDAAPPVRPGPPPRVTAVRRGARSAAVRHPHDGHPPDRQLRDATGEEVALFLTQLRQRGESAAAAPRVPAAPEAARPSDVGPEAAVRAATPQLSEPVRQLDIRQPRRGRADRRRRTR